MKISLFFKKIFTLSLLLIFCALIGKGWYIARDGLIVRRIIGWEDQSLELGWNEEAKSAMKQRFYNLGRGRQSYAFLSEDGRYVIKIPRYGRFRLPLWLQAMNLKCLESYRKHRIVKKQAAKEVLLQSFQIAFDSLKEESAIIAVRFPGEKGNGEVIKIADRLGRHYDLPLNTTGFVLQHKKVLFNEVFEKILLMKDREKIAHRFDQLLEVVATRARKGITCRDDAFMYNFGFDEFQAYQIDVGDFRRPITGNPKEIFDQSVQGSLKPIRAWIKKIDSDLLYLLDQKVEKLTYD